MGTPSLHQSIITSHLPAVAGPIHLPDVQQSLQPALKSEDPHLQPYRRKAVQVSAFRLRQGLFRAQQHEASRARLPRWHGSYGTPADGMTDRLQVKHVRRRVFPTRPHFESGANCAQKAPAFCQRANRHTESTPMYVRRQASSRGDPKCDSARSRVI